MPKLANLVTTKVTDVHRFQNYVNFLGAQNLKSFIIVRHPFHRLVSAFRDKLERSDLYYYKKHGQKIVAKYRHLFIDKFGEEYLSKVNNYGAPIPVQDGHYKMNRSSLLPTFWEFVQYVKDTDPESMDEHWKPMHLFCPICDVDFGYILKFENVATEGKYLMNILSPSAKQNLLDKVNVNHPKKINEMDLVAIYFNLLSESDIEALFKIYEFDFKMFDYEFIFNGKQYKKLAH